MVLDPVVFDDTKTGIMRNDTDRVVISCKAHGKPRPDLQLNLYNEYGPDLLESGLYKVIICSIKQYMYKPLIHKFENFPF